MFKFIGSVVKEMKLTTWPTRKQSVIDFFMVIEYTVFFLIFLMIFDWITQNGITSAVQHLLPFVRN
ncbi:MULTISPECIES: preprotein translocase subunit SecE [Lactococcus]|uniref:preprotein translocase subunit SecE n=1 Tax=Lactococcus TaxID=1357 RepID=UPI0015701779|nr:MULTISPECIES: preprotein translocase subunit SecE [Lactococcus]NSL25653.1 preprotein translocase subunit SecE [Lactococcus petauri]QSR04613.1 preprotein translocase subunit SecE [Lactococcus sp. LG1267]